MTEKRGGKENLERMLYLIDVLNRSSMLYYNKSGDGALTDGEYDKLANELVELEDILGVVLADSPSKKIGWYDPGHNKAPHIRPILSLRSTKSVDEMLYFIKDKEGVLSWKIDGISIVLYYNDGVLVNALTRGDGLIGRIILGKAMRTPNIPKKIRGKGQLVVRGEGCIALSDFQNIKKTEFGERFSNPRNVVAGIFNSDKVSSILLRHTKFIAHSIVAGGGIFAKRSDQFAYLQSLGFEVVPHRTVLNFRLKHEIEDYTASVQSYDYPVDGLVLTVNDISYGEGLGETSRFPRHSLAFKWPDEKKLSGVQGVKWSVSRSGLITPVVSFDPVALEGTIIKQANLHTLKRFEDLAIGKGDILEVYKANKIIPEVGENLTRSGTESYPRRCPICDAETEVVSSSFTRKLYCRNESCLSRSQKIQRL